MASYFWIGLGGALGSMARFWASGLVAHYRGETFPWGTLFVNVSGSFLIGVIDALTGPDGIWLAPPSFRQFLMIGILGGYTTFSSFSLQTLALGRDGEWLHAAANILFSVVLCLLGVWLGHVLGAAITSSKPH